MTILRCIRNTSLPKIILCARLEATNCIGKNRMIETQRVKTFPNSLIMIYLPGSLDPNRA